ncbi:unnamed protein product [Chondrus crispus]|uniref:Uncharacterized protein n=1 Tax=Chondrus crispus TaxID=2769 RepID=R7QLE9_CHOCR|nr:unnamed protein product [Chondrus crispus]CDF38588.1 unnamed protein product [Chondrus crispus]|eukprot:XP_005718493.1 unnamed protein product [Chondrus crispus]
METSFKSMALPTGSKGVASRSAGVQQEKGIASRRRWR